MTGLSELDVGWLLVVLVVAVVVVVVVVAAGAPVACANAAAPAAAVDRSAIASRNRPARGMLLDVGLCMLG
jgi:hypothetical protein